LESHLQSNHPSGGLRIRWRLGQQRSSMSALDKASISVSVLVTPLAVLLFVVRPGFLRTTESPAEAGMENRRRKQGRKILKRFAIVMSQIL
jgi:hypothetical protein